MIDYLSMVALGDYVFLAVIAFGVMLLVFWIWDRMRVQKRLIYLEGRVSGQVVPFWRAIQNEVIDELMHPYVGAERADELLLMLKHNPTMKISDTDRAELLRRMEAVANGEDPFIQGEEERDLARMFHIIMKNVQREDSDHKPIIDVQLVGLKRPPSYGRLQGL